MKPIDAGEQYEALARWVYRAAPNKGEPRAADLAMHKPLIAPVPDGQDLPAAGMQGLDEWLAGKISLANPRHVVDFGCGFGATLFTLAGIHQARLQGVAGSPFQINVAQQLAGRLGLAHRAEFSVGDFESFELEPSVDTLVAVESIGYARDLSNLAARLSEQLPMGGNLFFVDDWRARPSEEMGPNYDRFLTLWGREQIPSDAEVLAVFGDAGFVPIEIIDLTAQVPGLHRGTTLRRTLLRLALALTPNRRYRSLIAAFLGGCYLEALYADQKTRYRFIHLQKQGA